LLPKIYNQPALAPNAKFSGEGGGEPKRADHPSPLQRLFGG